MFCLAIKVNQTCIKRRQSVNFTVPSCTSCATDIVFSISWSRQEPRGLRCPETPFLSHENTNFLFSVFRVVQGEAKTSKIMGCCKANFAFLRALKIGTFRGKWTLEWVFKTSYFFRLALYFLINSKLAFLCMLLNDAWRKLHKTFDLERRTV